MLLVERMVAAMRSAPGVGLAALQVGVPFQVWSPPCALFVLFPGAGPTLRTFCFV